jgi:[ribosomal protein S5]-alanine N-acetyltransferase
MMHGILRTDRLLLRPAAATDASRLIAINEPTATDRVSKLIENQVSWWKEYSYGLWLIILPTTEALAGWCGLRPGNSPIEPELLFGLAAGERKRGIATEAVRAVLAYALALPNIQSVWAATGENNFASTAVMKRAGMSFEVQKELDGASMVLYRVRAPQRNAE